MFLRKESLLAIREVMKSFIFDMWLKRAFTIAVKSPVEKLGTPIQTLLEWLDHGE